jgi:hypothetical protein
VGRNGEEGVDQPAARARTSTPAPKIECPTSKKLIAKPGLKKHMKAMHAAATHTQSNDVGPGAGENFTYNLDLVNIAFVANLA